MATRSIAVAVLLVAVSACAGTETTATSSTTEPPPPATAAPDPLTTTSTTSSATTAVPTTAAPARPVVALQIRTRESWGARSPDQALEPHRVRAITLHHTAEALDDTPIEERLRNWQAYHQSLGFGDIAYHFVIAADGTIFEGRDFERVGATRTSYDPTGHFLLALDGMFDEHWDSPGDGDNEPDGADELTYAQLGALVGLLAWASAEFDVDPREITGHRDHAATACPGSVVYALLQSGEIAELVKQRIDAADFTLRYADE